YFITAKRADNEIGTGGNGLVIGGQGAGRRANGINEVDFRLAPGLAVVTAEQALAHRLRGGGETTAQRQQHGHLYRRTIAVAHRRRTLAGVELRRGFTVERARQRQTARKQGAAGGVV